jgi:hypothetical protein
MTGLGGTRDVGLLTPERGRLHMFPASRDLSAEEYSKRAFVCTEAQTNNTLSIVILSLAVTFPLAVNTSRTGKTFRNNALKIECLSQLSIMLYGGAKSPPNLTSVTHVAHQTTRPVHPSQVILLMSKTLPIASGDAFIGTLANTPQPSLQIATFPSNSTLHHQTL